MCLPYFTISESRPRMVAEVSKERDGVSFHLLLSLALPHCGEVEDECAHVVEHCGDEDNGDDSLPSDGVRHCPVDDTSKNRADTLRDVPKSCSSHGMSLLVLRGAWCATDENEESDTDTDAHYH